MGAALWETEINEPIGWDLLKKNLNFLFKQGIPTVNRILKDRKICKEHFPKHSPYFYLGMVGVLPEARGKGLASKLMNPLLNYCKINNIPAFLETANLTNVDIYKKKGFIITDIISKNNLNINYMKFE
jgi:GNAT superfamily N-acetyltransferase